MTREEADLIKECIDNTPTVETQPIVRCKNCRYFFPDEKRTKWGECKIWNSQVLKKGFCFQGEKNEKNGI